MSSPEKNGTYGHADPVASPFAKSEGYRDLLRKAAKAEAAVDLADDLIASSPDGRIPRPYWYYGDEHGLSVNQVRYIAIQLGLHRWGKRENRT